MLAEHPGPVARPSLRKIAFLFLLILAAGLAGGILYWTSSTLPPSPEALAALQSGSTVLVTQSDGLIVFQPAASPASTGFIFYPGGRVDYRAYAPLLRLIAAQGYPVFLVQMPLNLAFFDANAAERIIAQYPEVQGWVVGGHSLGGVAAATYAAKSDRVQGLVLWASYPADDALAGSQLGVLSISGALDGLSTPDKIEASRSQLPPDAQFVVIPGGNHSQFGAYGAQKGDNPASISAEEQAALVADATGAFLHSIISDR